MKDETVSKLCKVMGFVCLVLSLFYVVKQQLQLTICILIFMVGFLVIDSFVCLKMVIKNKNDTKH